MNGERWPCPKCGDQTGSTGYALFGEPERDSQRSCLLAASRDTEASLMSAFGVKIVAMHVLSRRKLAVVTIACGLALPALARAQAPVDDMAFATALRAGGLVILIRHGATFADQADTDPFNFDNIAAQRNLNENGKALAKVFGDALRQAGVPVGKVYTSKFNRAYETAIIAGFTDVEKTAADRRWPRRDAEREQSARRCTAQAAGDKPQARHQHCTNYPQAEHPRRAWQGLIRCQGRRGINISPREWQVRPDRTRADGGVARHCRGCKVACRSVR